MSLDNLNAVESRRAEGRIKRRFARFKDKENLVTRDPLVAELMLAQIDATLSVSHAIQELSGYVDNVAYHMPSVEVGNTTVLKSRDEADIESIRRSLAAVRDAIRDLRDRTDILERNVSTLASATVHNIVQPSAVVPQPPWWAFWRGW